MEVVGSGGEGLDQGSELCADGRRARLLVSKQCHCSPRLIVRVL